MYSEEEGARKVSPSHLRVDVKTTVRAGTAFEQKGDDGNSSEGERNEGRAGVCVCVCVCVWWWWSCEAVRRTVDSH